MTRQTDVRRDSHLVGPRLFASPEQKAMLEARNGLLQFDEVARLAAAGIKAGVLRLRPSTLQALQRLAIHEIYTCAGNWRTQPVSIHGTTHEPPEPHRVPELVDEMCDYINEHWAKSAVHLSAYAMWRLNWIHPFAGGNGRTSRALSYLVLCVRAGVWFPGTSTIPEQITANREPYYAALDAADAAWAGGEVDLSVMEQLLSAMLAKQLLDVHNSATDGDA